MGLLSCNKKTEFYDLVYKLTAIERFAQNINCPIGPFIVAPYYGSRSCANYYSKRPDSPL